MRIIIIEDDLPLALNISKKLEKNGFKTIIFNNIKDFRENYGLEADLYIVDIWLPDWSWLELLRWLRKDKKNTTPVIISSWYNDTDKKIYWLDIWADDYITKPVVPSELISRINAVLRRYGKFKKEVLVYKNIEINLFEKKVYKDKKEIFFTKKEFELTKYFIENTWKLLLKIDIITNVWNDSDSFEFKDNTLNVNVSKIRKKLWDEFNLRTRVNDWYILEK